MYMKKGGWHLNKEQPFIRNDIWFLKRFKMEKILDSIYTPHQITQWDTNVKQCYQLPNMATKSYNLEYKSLKRQMTITERDMIDKSI